MIIWSVVWDMAEYNLIMLQNSFVYRFILFYCIVFVGLCENSVGSWATILDYSTLQQQGEGTGIVVRLFQKGSAEAQPPNPSYMKFVAG